MNELLKCIIVDDEPLARDVIKGYIEQTPQLQFVASCGDVMEAFKVINQSNIDLLFLDIEMPEMNGIEFIKSIANPPKVILTTAYRKYAIESYEINVVDYLLKPISFNRFFKSITRVLSDRVDGSSALHVPEHSINKGSIYIYADKKNHKVYFDTILYLESVKDYVRVHTTTQNLITKDTITHYEQTLPKSFLRVHRSFIVNTDKISAYTQHDIEIGAKEIPIGGSYKRQVLEILKE